MLILLDGCEERGERERERRKDKISIGGNYKYCKFAKFDMQLEIGSYMVFSDKSLRVN
jgi:hypothetical protein